MHIGELSLPQTHRRLAIYPEVGDVSPTSQMGKLSLIPKSNALGGGVSHWLWLIFGATSHPSREFGGCSRPRKG